MLAILDFILIQRKMALLAENKHHYIAQQNFHVKQFWQKFKNCIEELVLKEYAIMLQLMEFIQCIFYIYFHLTFKYLT